MSKSFFFYLLSMYSIITAVLLLALCHLTLHIQYMLQFGKAFSFSFYSCNKVLCSSRVNTREPSDWSSYTVVDEEIGDRCGDCPGARRQEAPPTRNRQTRTGKGGEDTRGNRKDEVAKTRGITNGHLELILFYFKSRWNSIWRGSSFLIGTYLRVKQDRQKGHNVGRNLIWKMKSERDSSIRERRRPTYAPCSYWSSSL